MRRPTALVLVAFALLAAPMPEAVAQAPPRPEPRELWRQFPLETGRSNAQRPAESMPEVSVPTTRGTPREGTDGSVQTATIVLAIALVLMLTTGALAYAARGQFEFGAFRRRRRPAESFLEAPPVEAPPQPETERPTAAAMVVARITAEVDALRAKLDVDAAQKGTESPTQDIVKRLRERLNTYFVSAKNAGTANDEVDSLKAKLDARVPAKSESIPHDERERLREKLDMPAAYTESPSHDELRALKEKLGAQAAAPKGVNTTQEELETLKAKLPKQAAIANAERETADEAALKEKLSGAAAAANRETAVRARLETQLAGDGPRPTIEPNVDLHAPDTTLREPRGERATAATPVAPRPVSAATRRSTIADLVSEHGKDVATIGLALIALALLLLNIAVSFGIGVVS